MYRLLQVCYRNLPGVYQAVRCTVLRPRCRSFGSTGVGVHGEHFGSGYGGQFKGGRAQLRFVHSTRTGRPKGGTHAKGELFMDSDARLFVCVGGGSPGR
jgi:hypothetical protein